jgi:hypothetical protein
MDIEAALAKRYPSPAWATFWEITNDAGFRGHRRADCVAMSLWPSRGLTVIGVEIKRDRRDWLRELGDPEKSAPIQKFCDHWYLAVSDAKIVRDDEIPQTWGLLVLDGKKLVTVKEAPKLEPEALTRGFVAVLLRNGTKGMIPQAQIEEIVQQRLATETRQETRDVTTATAMYEKMTKAFNELRDRVHAFQEASGININERWNAGPLNDPGKLGIAVRALLSGKMHGLEPDLKRARNSLEQSLAELTVALEVVSALAPGEER